MLSALCKGYQALRDDALLERALKQAEFFKSPTMLRDGHVLMRSFRAGAATVEGFLDDYAFLIQGAGSVPSRPWPAAKVDRLIAPCQTRSCVRRPAGPVRVVL